MPGSLFSRSPTPDDSADVRRVRFASDIASPVPRRQRPLTRRESQAKNDQQLDKELEEGGGKEGGNDQSEEEDPQSNSDEDSESRPSPSPCRADVNSHLPSPYSQRSYTITGPFSHPVPARPLRPPIIEPVKEAVARLDEDPPLRPITPTWSATGKGKERQIEMESQILWPVVDKGKNKGSARPRSDLTFGVSSSVNPIESIHGADTGMRHSTSKAISVVHSTGNGSAIDEEVVRRRIQELEEKVRSLESEVCLSHFNHVFGVHSFSFYSLTLIAC